MKIPEPPCDPCVENRPTATEEPIALNGAPSQLGRPERRPDNSVLQHRSVLPDVAALCFLTLLVWGLFALDRGLWRDDVISLSRALRLEVKGSGWTTMVTPRRNAPTRCLKSAPYFLALRTQNPRVTLQLFYGAVWLGIGICCYRLARGLFPRHPRLAAIAGGLTLCSTGDSYSMSVGSLTQNLSVLTFLLAVDFSVKWLSGGRLRWLLASGAALSLSIWNTDVALTSLALAPLFFWTTEQFRLSRRLAIAVGFWMVVALPYLGAFLSALLDPSSYVASRGFVRHDVGDWLIQTAAHFGHNFTPWRWAFNRPVFESVPAPIIPRLARFSLTSLGTAVFLLWISSKPPASRGVGDGRDGATRWWSIFVLFLLLCLAANSMFTLVQLSELFHRTHLLSRVWSSLALALLAERLIQVRLSPFRKPTRGGWPGLCLAAFFVFFGLLGGLERQDYYLSTWLAQRQELASILRAAPSLDEKAVLILQVPDQAEGLATFNTSIARNWATLLYGRPSFLRERLFSISRRGGGCRPETNGLRCWHERDRARLQAGEYEGKLVRYGNAVVMRFSPAEHRYRLASELPRDLRPHRGAASVDYEPEALITDASVSNLAKALLGGGNLLARFLPRVATEGVPSGNDPLTAEADN